MNVVVSVNTPNRLVLRLTPVAVGAYWFFGWLFIALGVWCAWLLRSEAPAVGLGLGVVVMAGGVACIIAIEAVLVVLDRDAGTVTVRSRRWGQWHTSEAPLRDLRGTAHQVFQVRHSRSWWVYLVVAKGGRIPLTRGPMFTERSRDEVVTVIEEWLAPGPGETAA